MLSTIGMTRREVGRKMEFAGASCMLRAAGYCIAVLLVVGLAGCEYLQNMSAGQANSVRSAGSAVRSVQPDKTVRHVQSLLAKQGYDPGPVDGLLGSRTVEAIREYQKAAGLPADGKISTRLIRSLESGQHAKLVGRTESSTATMGSPAAKHPMLAKGVFGAEYGDIQPIYTLGDAFVWSSGHVERVARVGADNVVWRSTDGTGKTAFRSFAAPPLEWQTETAEGSSKIGIGPLEIWSLEVGASIEFEVLSASRKLGQDSLLDLYFQFKIFEFEVINYAFTIRSLGYRICNP